MSGMSKATRTLIPLLLGLLSVSTHGAGDEASRLDGRWRAGYTSSPSAFYEPGDPRPTEFDEKAGETMRLVREGG